LPIGAIAYFAALDTGNGLIKMSCEQLAIRLVILPNHIKFKPIRATAVIAYWLEGLTFEIRALFFLQEYGQSQQLSNVKGNTNTLLSFLILARPCKFGFAPR
jgi:hypothetical protein